MRAERRDWTADEVRNLKAMAGKYFLDEIALMLGRGPSAVKAKAYELRISLKVHDCFSAGGYQPSTRNQS
jgi:hypothetical protein